MMSSNADKVRTWNRVSIAAFTPVVLAIVAVPFVPTQTLTLRAREVALLVVVGFALAGLGAALRAQTWRDRDRAQQVAWTTTAAGRRLHTFGGTAAWR